jgi:hypothetical protein
MKYAAPSPYADPEKAARRIVEVACAVEPRTLPGHAELSYVQLIERLFI